MSERIVLRAERAARLDVVVGGAVPSRSRAAALIRDGHVRLRGAVCARPSTAVAVGDEVEIAMPDPVPSEAQPQDLPLRIVYEDAHLVVVDKDPGMVVHPAAGHHDGTLVNALLHHVGDLSGIGGVERPGIVHRLDKGTSGLLVVAKGDAAHHALADQFADHSAGRDYLALCLGVPAEERGRVESHLGRHPADRMRFASVGPARGKRAVTHWRRLAAAEGVSLIACRLETGRTHQVRVHMSESGWPLLGDAQYGRRASRVPERLRALIAEDRPLLHAWRLHFRHPASGEMVEFEAPIPADFRAVLDALAVTDQALATAG